jgi:hypothetical protein
MASYFILARVMGKLFKKWALEAMAALTRMNSADLKMDSKSIKELVKSK